MQESSGMQRVPHPGPRDGADVSGTSATTRPVQNLSSRETIKIVNIACAIVRAAQMRGICWVARG